jgi:serine/threonine protein phosphatase 1
LFLHRGLSPELSATADEQVAAMHLKKWDRAVVQPLPGTKTESLWQLEYPVWIGADRKLSKSPLPYRGKVQVTGHVQVSTPDVSPTRIRLDTSGGFGAITACLLRSSDAEPEFYFT